ncbi:MAG: ABC transporter permease [Eubacteriales bacterium]
MKEMFLLAVKSVFRKKKSSATSVICIALCIASVTAVASIFSSAENAVANYYNDRFGTYTAIVNAESDETLTALSDSYADCGLIYDMGVTSTKAGIYDGSVFVGYVDDTARRLLDIDLREGRLPQKDGEVAAEASALIKLDVALSVGEELSLSFQSANGACERSYTLVGIIGDYSDSQGAESENFGFPSILVAEEEAMNFSSLSRFAVTDLDIEELGGQFEVLHTSPRYSGGAETVIGENARILIPLLSASILLMALLSVISYLSFSGGDFRSECRLLRLLGGRREELFSFSLAQSASYCFLAAFPGTMLGLLAGYAVFSFIGGVMDGAKYVPSLAETLLGIFIPCAAVIITSVIRGLVYSSQKPAEIGKTQSKSGELCHRSNTHGSIFFRWNKIVRRKNGGAYLSISALLFLSFFAVNMGFVFTQTVTEEYGKNLPKSYSVVSSARNEYFTSFKIPTSPYYGIPSSAVSELSALSEVLELYSAKQLDVMVFEESGSYRSEKIASQTVREIENDDEIYFEQATQFGVPKDCDVYLKQLREYNRGYLSYLFAKANMTGKCDVESLSDGQSVAVLCRSAESCPYKVGDVVRLNQLLKSPDGGNKYDKFYLELSVCAIIETQGVKDELGQMGGVSDFLFAVGEGFFESRGFNIGCRFLDIELRDDASHDKTEKVLSSLSAAMPEVKIVSRVYNNAQMRSLITSLRTVAVSVGLFVYVIAMLTFLNLMEVKYTAQRYVWGNLKAIGVEKMQIVRAHLRDCLAFSLPSVSASALFMLLLEKIIPRRLDFMNGSIAIVYVLTVALTFVLSLPIPLGVAKKKVVELTEYIE